jgi:hypothetical protein
MRLPGASLWSAVWGVTLNPSTSLGMNSAKGLTIVHKELLHCASPEQGRRVQHDMARCSTRHLYDVTDIIVLLSCVARAAMCLYHSICYALATHNLYL